MENPWDVYFRGAKLSSTLENGQKLGVMFPLINKGAIGLGNEDIENERMRMRWDRLEEIYEGLIKMKHGLIESGRPMDMEVLIGWALDNSKRLEAELDSGKKSDMQGAAVLMWTAWLVMERILGYGSFYLVTENEMVTVDLADLDERLAVDSDLVMDFVTDRENWIGMEAISNLSVLADKATDRVDKRVKQFKSNAIERLKFDSMKGVIFENTMNLIREHLLPRMVDIWPVGTRKSFPMVRKNDAREFGSAISGWFQKLVLSRYDTSSGQQRLKSELTMLADGVFGYMTKMVIQSMSLWYMSDLKDFGYTVYLTPQLGKVKWNLYDLMRLDEQRAWVTEYMKQAWVPLSEVYDKLLDERLVLDKSAPVVVKARDAQLVSMRRGMRGGTDRD